MFHRTLNDLTSEEVLLLGRHLDALDAEALRCRRIAADLLRGVSADLSEVISASPDHPIAIRVRRILASLREIAGPRA